MRRLALCLLLLVTPALAQDDGTPSPDGGEAKPAEGGEPGPADGEQGEKPSPDGEKPEKGRGKKAKPGARELDTESEVARKLAAKLHVNPRYASDGSVELIYTFADPEEQGDWVLSGFDRADEGRMGKRRARKPAGAGARRAMDLGVGSGDVGLMRHVLAFVGDFELTATLKVDRSSGESDLVLFRGEGGLRWAAQLVRRSGDAFRPVVGEPDRDPFAGGRLATLRLVHEGGTLRAYVDGKERASTQKLMEHLDGAVGLYARDMLFRVDRIEIRAKPDPKKLD